MLKYVLLFALFVQACFGQSQCGPAQCYSGCTDARPQVDIVFSIDVSGSMAPKIAGVRDGFTSFANNLKSKNLDVRYAIVTFGGDGSNSGQSAAVVQSFTSDTAVFVNRMNQITRVSGGWEAGLETLRTVLGTASGGNLGLSYRSGSNNKRVFVLVTDEDSDPATISSNRYQGTTTRDSLCRGTAASPACCTITDIDDSTWNGQWQPEVNKVFQDLAAVSPNLYMFVAGIRTVQQTNIPSNQRLDGGQTCNTYFQYCNPDSGIQVQNGDYSNFDSTATLNKLRTTLSKGRSMERSLQGQFLASGRLARCFDVIDAKDPNLITNFFAQITADISSCNACFDYLCSGSNCQAPVNRCGCDGVRNSGKVLDSAGNCCLPSERDCAGICNGPNKYDSCGVCTNGGALFPNCVKDCNNNFYLNLPPNPTSLSAYSRLIYQTSCPNVAGYLLQNNDILKNVYQVQRTTQSVCTHFHTYGRFEGRKYCTLDSAHYASQHSVSAANAETDWLASLLTASPKSARCLAGSNYIFPPLTKDSCDQCIVSLDSPPYCVKDCSGVFRKQASAAFFTDNCGYCVAPGTNPDARKDDCQVCDGNNVAKNECGQCFGVRGRDGCNQNVCLNLTCGTDCDGVQRNPLTKKVDECRNCVLITLGRDPKCKQDCAKVWYNELTATSSPNIVDECGNCVPRALVRADTCKQDCNGTWAGTSFLDQCNQCVVDGKTPFPCETDCRGGNNYYRVGSTDPYFKIDDCGQCNSLANQNIDKDNCGKCKSVKGYNSTAQCTPDCKGQWLLVDDPNRAFVDFCGSCWFANQTNMRNYLLDDCNTCHKSRNDIAWNKVTSYDDLGNPCSCGTKPKTCDDGLRICIDSCPNITCTSRDSCNRCPGEPLYNIPRDDCGKCCNPSITDPKNSSYCNSDKDSCGVCFGFDKYKENPCKICDPWFSSGNSTLCVPDCKGIYNGNNTYGCDGVCGSNATCTTTIVPADNNTAAIVGGVIGGIVALVALILAVLLAVKYAHSAGLFGMANKQVDFGASNQNPLYKSEVAVHQNPLYGAS